MRRKVWVICILVIRYCFEFRVSCFEFVISKQKRPTHPYGVLPESPVLRAGILYCSVSASIRSETLISSIFKLARTREIFL